ncbi:phenolpthiocerol synthesis polyketide synthase ppsA [Lophiotrema nucula]|uniref:Phenolpthiocerol synthesis polyketide synthase ppsA n=1 Tax=Lophiotrema nucula TaxID=690887 RepID=A0A6A5YLG3_9PLEO|nr:phenolpthiocerol synthesis polyketide synthase ppsA [Lophiotrema nucula]
MKMSPRKEDHDTHNGGHLEPIAIIGMACRFPQDATSPTAFWNMLQEGRSAMTEIPTNRFNVDAFYNSDTTHLDTTTTRGGHFLSGNIAAFDAPFFSIPKQEAEALDPQQRGLLECTYHALENTGLQLSQTNGTQTGVFVGCMGREYDWTLARDPDAQHQYQAIGSGSAMLSNRLSWFYDWKGPSLTIDTACSSSMIALHLACQSLRNGESSMAAVGGANIIINPDNMIAMSNLNFLSPDGLCYSFDHRANGYSRGEGFGVLIIKSLSQAIKDNNTVRALIRATYCNQDGRTPGITNPNKDAQIALIKGTYDMAGLSLHDTGFFEAHGTGTQAGDVTEATAIQEVFGDVRSKQLPIIVGALKSNIGHLEGASGIASIIKTVMVLEKGIIPPNANFEKVNPKIPFPTEPTPWPSSGLRRASVNSFGYGGANAHAVLDDASYYMASHSLKYQHSTQVPNSDGSNVPSNGLYRHDLVTEHEKSVFLNFSASDEDSLEKLCQELQAHQQASPNASPATRASYIQNLAYTLSSKRDRLRWRSFSSVGNDHESSKELITSTPIRSPTSTAEVAFIFTGQGAAWWDMGRELFAELIYRQSMSHSNQYLHSMGCQWDIFEELMRGEEHSRIALVDLLRSWGVKPSAVVGHSSGEIAAAYCAGALSHRTAIQIAFFRGKISEELYTNWNGQHEGMMVVALPLHSVEARLPLYSDQGPICVACVNSPKHITLAGSLKALNAMRKNLEVEGVFAKRLRVDVAYHSPTMERLSGQYSECLRGIEIDEAKDKLVKASGRLTMFSSVTGAAVSTYELRKPSYWVTNMISRVRFSDALLAMREHLDSTRISYFIEIGPTNALRRPILETLGDVLYSPCLGCEISAYKTILTLVGNLWSYKVPLDLLAVNDIKVSATNAEVKMLTDLPQYPFNHSRTYWHESRMNKNIRFRKQPRHPLLGVREGDNNAVAKWKNTLRVRELPWIEDHRINGSRLYPAAGMVVMAIEAARQLVVGDLRDIDGFRIRDFHILKALFFPTDTEALDTEIYLHSDESGHTTSSWKFQICYWSNEVWAEACHGIIVVEAIDFLEDSGREQMLTHEARLELQEHLVDHCVHTVLSKHMYDNFTALGFNYGPAFRSLDNVRWSDNCEAVATMPVVRHNMNNPAREFQSLISPLTLEGLFQVPLTAVSHGSWKAIPTMVPSEVGDLWLSAKLFDLDNGEMNLSTRGAATGLREYDFEVTASASDSSDVLATFDGYRVTAISEAPPGNWRRICFKESWKMDIATATAEEVARHCERSTAPLADTSESSVDEAELVCLYFVRKALEAPPGTFSDQAHLRKFVQWMEHSLQLDHFQALLESREMSQMFSDGVYAENVLSRIENSGPEGKVYTTIGRNLSSIIRGDVDVIDLLFGGDLLQRFYAGTSFLANYERMRAYVDLLAHKNPSMSVLEIGAGTGGATVPIMEALGRDSEDPHSTPRYQAYDYTDISAGFFGEARERFSNFKDRMNFRVLDIERPPGGQGFEKEKYDLIIASCVLHATSDISQTLQNTRSLLRPGGKLLLFEPTHPTCARLPFVFGLLEGWWLAKEESRALSPLLLDESWDEALRQNGFSGADLCLRDYEGRSHTFSVIVTTAINSSSVEAQTLEGIAIFADPGSELQIAVAAKLKDQLQQTQQATCTVLHPSNIGSAEFGSCFCVSLVELDRPLLHRITPEHFALLREAANNLTQVLWVTSDSTQNPLAALTTGFARSLSSEIDTLSLTILSLHDLSSPVVVASRILRVARLPAHERENEYMERSGQLCINRVVEDNEINNIIFYQTVTQPPELVRLGDIEGGSFRLTSSFLGGPDALHFVEDDQQPALGDDDVEIAVKAIGINMQDSKIAFGEARGTSFAQECAGMITRTGSSVLADKFVVGDRVCCWSKDAFRSNLTCHVSTVQKIQSHVTFAEAATIPIAWCTAYYSLYRLAQIGQGESLLIVNAIDPVGQAALRFARLRNAEIFATVSSEQQREFLIENHELREDHVFFNQSSATQVSIKRMTGGKGVNVVLRVNFNESRMSSLGCLALFGRLVDVQQRNAGKLGPEQPRMTSAKNTSVFTVDILDMLNDAPEVVQHIFTEAMQLYSNCRTQELTVKAVKSFPAPQVTDAIRCIKNDDTIDRVVVELSANDFVPIAGIYKPRWDLEASATYIIAGGTGGLGRSIARWMISKGAKHIVLLGRSGSQSKGVQDLIAEGKRKNVKVLAPACDVSDIENLRQAMDDSSGTMPSVKGCIQASMILRDSLLQNMSHDMFTEVLAPKVQGTINLQKLLPRTMDFFILLSSTTGIFGSRGQSNYAASSTFQNAFAKHLTSQGQKCLSLDLGMMLGVGYAAERQHITDSLRAAGYDGISEAEFHALLNWACNPNLALKQERDDHVITGISTPAAIKAKGLDEIFWMRKPVFRGLHQMDRISTNIRVDGASSELTDYRSLIQRTSTTEAAGEVIAQGLVAKLSKALTLPVEDFDTAMPIHTYGVDSLVSVEIRYWCKKEFDADVAVFDILQGKSIAELCLMIARKSDLVSKACAASNSPANWSRGE